MLVDPKQGTMVKEGKPLYYFVAEMTTDNGVMYKMYPIKSYQDWIYCQNFCKRYKGTDAIVYVKPSFVEEKKLLQIIARALKEIGAI